MKIDEAALWAEVEKYDDIRENGIERYIFTANRLMNGVHYDTIDKVLDGISEDDLQRFFNEICFCNNDEYPEIIYGVPRVSFTIDELYFNGRFPNYLWSNARKKSSFL